MEKIQVEYKGGESRYGTEAVDYMRAQLKDGRELYEELPAHADDETGTYEELKILILIQAADAGIPFEQLEFWFD